jgi:hypothetical protein
LPLLPSFLFLAASSSALAQAPDTTAPAPAEQPAAEPAPGATPPSTVPPVAQATSSRDQALRKRFRRGGQLALAGTVAVPSGVVIGNEGFKHLSLFGAGPEPFYAAPMFLGGWGAAIVGYPLQVVGTRMQRRALAEAGCPPRPKALPYAAPTMLVGAAASFTTELFPSYAETAAGLAIGAWAVSGAETLMLRAQGKRCAGLQP